MRRLRCDFLHKYLKCDMTVREGAITDVLRPPEPDGTRWFVVTGRSHLGRLCWKLSRDVRDTCRVTEDKLEYRTEKTQSSELWKKETEADRQTDRERERTQCIIKPKF